MTSRASNETPRTLFAQLKVQTFPIYGREMCVPSHNALRRVHRKWSLTDPSIAYLYAFTLIKSSEIWITAQMSIVLHCIRRITIVQSNLGLNSFSDVVFCNCSHNIVFTTGEVVYYTLDDTQTNPIYIDTSSRDANYITPPVSSQRVEQLCSW
jgi:hypothetical protein